MKAKEHHDAKKHDAKKHDAKKHGATPGDPPGPAKAKRRGCAGGTCHTCHTPADAPPVDVGPGAHAAGVDASLKSANLRHLKRIEGQVRGIAAMIEDDRYCADVIQQCAAVQESLRSVARNLLRNHLGHCARRAMQGDTPAQEAMVDEIVELVARIAR